MRNTSISIVSIYFRDFYLSIILDILNWVIDHNSLFYSYDISFHCVFDKINHIRQIIFSKTSKAGII